MKLLKTIAACLALLFLAAAPLQAAAVVDDAGQKLEFAASPKRVVSLVPSATEVIGALGAGSSLAGITYHDSHLPPEVNAAIIGGSFSPQYSLINDLKPDLLIVAPRDFEKAKTGRGDKSYSILVWDDSVSLAESETRIRGLGAVFRKREEAETIIGRNRDLLKTIQLKVDKIPVDSRKRVMRLLSTPGGLLTPNSDFFQNELIAAAGGIPPRFVGGSFVPIDLSDWRSFDPEVIFVCGADLAPVKERLNREGWREAPAVKNGRIYTFPCALTCRAATHTGDFAAWLASTIYGAEFADQAGLVHASEVVSEQPLSLDFDYVAKARVMDSRQMDFIHRTLLIDFKRPQSIASTVNGARKSILTIGNSFAPTPTWNIYHQIGFERSQEDLFKILNLDKGKTEIMLTGADLNNLAVKTVTFQDMKVTALVTAGVEGNALRTSRDAGAWYEPGTINIIVMTNHNLTEGAASRALITITEAKTAALWDMDIRSVQTPLANPATGTGTDNIIVVAGEGKEITGTGGHTKMGELIAEAVYGAVQEALLKQNGLRPNRNVLLRLAERGLTPHNLIGGPDCPCQEDFDDFQGRLEEFLLQPRYQGFLEAALSLSDAAAMGQVADLGSFEKWSLAVAGEIAGRPVHRLEKIIERHDLPPVLATALNAIGTGVKYREAGRAQH